MKTFNYIAILLMASILLFFLNSCNNDPDCGDNGLAVDGECVCEPGYSGDNCEIFDPCFGIVCTGNTTCIDGNCECTPGYIGNNCDEIDPCFGVECPENASCIEGECICNEGYIGDNCDEPDPCLGIECTENAICIDGICECEAGYIGDNCETALTNNILGYYTVIDVCPVDIFEYTCEIVEPSSPDSEADFLIEGFGGFDSPVILVTAIWTGTNADETLYYFEMPNKPYPGINSIGSIPNQNNIHGIYDTATGTLSVIYQIIFDNNETQICDMTLSPI